MGYDPSQLTPPPKKLLASYLNPTSRWTPFESGVEPLPDNIVINGRGTYNCSVVSTTYPPTPDSPDPACTGGAPYTTKVRSGQSVRLRLINHSSFFSYWASLDNHTLEIVEIDGIEVEPIRARGVYLNIGQRYSVVVKADRPRGNYLLRADLVKTCFLPYAPYQNAALESSGFAAVGVVSYDDVDVTENPVGISWNETNVSGVANNPVRGQAWEGCEDMPFDKPIPKRKQVAYEVGPENMHYFEFEFRQSQEVNRIFINKVSLLSYIYLMQSFNYQ